MSYIRPGKYKPMQITDATRLISGVSINKERPEVWADLGCGSGTFTQALARILPENSIIYAVDRSVQSIPQSAGKEVSIRFIQADFERDQLPLPALDGILMANSLHYIRDKQSLMERLKHYFTSDEQFIMIEYDMMQANPWVPYPLDFSHLEQLSSDAGFRNVVKLGERRSVYGKTKMYAGLVRR